MQIEISPNTRIVSDSRQFIVQTRFKREKPAEDGSIYGWRDRGYFVSIDAAAHYLLEQFVRESEATDITTLRDELAAYKAELTEAVADLRELPRVTT